MRFDDVQNASTQEREAPLLTKLLSQLGLPATLSTEEAAEALHRKPQTLRKWACLGTGPIQPIRINGRLAWPVAALIELLKHGSK